MAKYQNIDAAIDKIRTEVQEKYFFENIEIPLHFSNQMDIRGTLELLNTTNDVTLQTKIFSVLSACLLLNKDANFEVIIKYSAVYDRINNVLVKGLPRKAVHALNFLSALLYVDAEDDGPTKRRTLALYAKNMIRISGCLATMSDMFTNCMMYHDTWNALCQCLAAACGGSDLNQSYCTHLIPVCIRRCNQTNLEIFLVLQSLLLNHNKNMELFLNCNGILMFTRELLHYDKCLQLLITVVDSVAPSLLLRQVQVLNDLRDFLRIYGPNSQIGQKAKIILNHIDLHSRGSDLRSESHQASKENIPNKFISKEDGNDNAQIYECDKIDQLDDTATLMQKVLKEVFNFKQNQVESMKKVAPKADLNTLIRSTSTMTINSGGQKYERQHIMTNTSNKTKKVIGQQRGNKLYFNDVAELSLSFLQNYTNGHGRNREILKTIDRSKIFKNQKVETDKVIKSQTMANTENDLPYSYRTMSNEKPTSIDPKEFRPIFSSTPKHEEFSNLTDHSKISSRKSRFPTQTPTTLQRTRKVVKPKPKPMLRKNDKSLRNTSLSSRFFSAINESCTALVKTVANIFKKAEPSDFSKDRTDTNTSRAENDPTCSFSFLNYMQKRDAVLNKLLKTRNKGCTNFSLGTELCDTCDTHTLKKKMARNEHLKQTVKKLKLGINLYGCDFKKISKAMWPRESYMTPIVLYNLYRKLLLK